MDTSTLQSSFAYKAWANDEALKAMARLDDPVLAADRDIALRILNHTYIVDRIFAANLRRMEHGYQAPNAALLPALEELAQAMRNSDQWYIAYVAGLGAAELAERIDFTFTDGAPGRMSRAEMLMHVALHGSYHRGQLGLLMLKNGLAPPNDGFTTYLHQAEASARRRAA
jgi:uncharacterized damage-inducible protein DinB